LPAKLRVFVFSYLFCGFQWVALIIAKRIGLNGGGGVLVLGVGLIALKFWDFHFDFGAAIAVESFK